MNVARLLTVFSLLLLAACATTAPAPALFTLADPRGDDHGDGSIVYPMNREIEQGDLDLLELSATPVAGGTSFEATFAKRIRPPARRTIDSIGTSLESVARFGFYTFNLDIYIDTDRVPGSGSVATLPGRKALVDSANAWERVICLTPRPLEARASLRRLLTREGVEKLEKESQTLTPQQLDDARRQLPLLVDEHIFFPTNVDVVGNRIQFFVPDDFFSTRVSPDWSYVVTVTGSDLNQTIDLSGLVGAAASSDSLMMLPVRPGRPLDVFGGGHEDSAQPPIVDLIAGRGKTQEQILGNYDPRGTQPAVLPGVVPSTNR